MNMKLTQLEGREDCLAPGAGRAELLSCVGQIPPLPQSVWRILNLLDDPACDVPQLTDAVQIDAGLVASVLTLASSAAFARTSGGSSIEQALQTIGFAPLRSLVLAASLQEMIRDTESAGRLLWENSLATALFARKLAESRGDTRSWSDEVFLMGLLHRLGHFAFMANPQTRIGWHRVLERIRQSGMDYVEAELEVFQFSHVSVGFLLASRWKLPADICHVILNYRAPLVTAETPLQRKLAMVKLADLLAHQIGLGAPVGLRFQQLMFEDLARVLGLFGVAGTELVALAAAVRKDFDAEARAWPA